ncbi:MAG: hypothetical protein HW406_2957, partial [Candidatus Brocadiaceae bacterium]|nr:hypothetical protein [Candidatus Brocadiaceae bacterium]
MPTVPITDKQQESVAVKRSLNYSIKDGVAFAATTGFGDNYLNPFAVAIGATNLQIGLLSSFTQLVSSLMQLKAADITERLGSRKKVIVLSVFFQAFMLLPVAIIPYLPQSIQVRALILFSTLYLLFASFANPPWGSLMADLVPEGKRGEFFSKRGRIVGLVTVISAFLAGYILHLFKKQSLAGFTIIFLVALVSSGNFGKYVVFHSSFSFAVFLASPFFPVFMLRDLGFSYITYTIVTTTVPLASILAVSYWGRRADAIGNRRIIK